MVLLMDNQRGDPAGQVATLLALGLICGLLLAAFLFGSVIQNAIGTGSANLLRRVMGLLLAALAVNMVLSAVAMWLHLPPI
jgi:multiple antibiotic resistance protein